METETMTARSIKGAPVAARITEGLRREIERLREQGRVPTLVGVLVGANPGSVNYAGSQERACERAGIGYRLVRLDEKTTLPELVACIADLSADPEVSGIMLHRPLPEHLEGEHVPTLIPPHVDVEGMHPENLGRLIYRSGGLPPCTAMAAVELLSSTGVPIEGSEVVVVGHSEIVGKPIALWMLNRLATTTVCHHATRDLAEHTRRADILFVAVGKPGLIRGDMVREGAVVIDIGINRVRVETPDGKKKWKTVGDVDEASVSPVAGFLTPVPGGVGPVTVSMLLQNTVDAALRAAGLGDKA